MPIAVEQACRNRAPAAGIPSILLAVLILAGSGAAPLATSAATEPADAWTQSAKLTPPSTTSGGSYYGAKVIADGHHVAVAAYNESFHALAAAGAVYVSEIAAASANEPLRLTSPKPASQDRFGFLLAIDGEWLAIGTRPGEGEFGEGGAQGAVYLYRLDGTAWRHWETLENPTPVTGGIFPAALAMSDGILVVGALGPANANAQRAGEAFVYRFDEAAWKEDGRLVSDAGGGRDGFGSTVTAGDGRVAVGAPQALQADAHSSYDVGAVYVFAPAAGGWRPEAKLTSPAVAKHAQFGSALAMDGATLVVGTPRDRTPHGELAGSAHVFERSAEGWDAGVRLIAWDGAAADYFGNAVAVRGGTVAVGSPLADSAAATNVGAVYIFHGESWAEATRLQASPLVRESKLGVTLALADGTLVAGTRHRDIAAHDARGAAYLFAGPDGATEESSYTSCDASGAWSTSWGLMRLTQTDDFLRGTYDWFEGTLDGRAEKRVVTGEWAQANDRGRFVFTFSTDCRSFTGSWNRASDPEGEWVGPWAGERSRASANAFDAAEAAKSYAALRPYFSLSDVAVSPSSAVFRLTIAFPSEEMAFEDDDPNRPSALSYLVENLTLTPGPSQHIQRVIGLDEAEIDVLLMGVEGLGFAGACLALDLLAHLGPACETGAAAWSVGWSTWNAPIQGATGTTVRTTLMEEVTTKPGTNMHFLVVLARDADTEEEWRVNVSLETRNMLDLRTPMGRRVPVASPLRVDASEHVLRDEQAVRLDRTSLLPLPYEAKDVLSSPPPSTPGVTIESLAVSPSRSYALLRYVAPPAAEWSRESLLPVDNARIQSAQIQSANIITDAEWRIVGAHPLGAWTVVDPDQTVALYQGVGSLLCFGLGLATNAALGLPGQVAALPCASFVSIAAGNYMDTAKAIERQHRLDGLLLKEVSIPLTQDWTSIEYLVVLAPIDGEASAPATVFSSMTYQADYRTRFPAGCDDAGPTDVSPRTSGTLAVRARLGDGRTEPVHGPTHTPKPAIWGLPYIDQAPSDEARAERLHNMKAPTCPESDGNTQTETAAETSGTRAEAAGTGLIGAIAAMRAAALLRRTTRRP